MGMETYAITECVISENKIKNECREEFEHFMDTLSKFECDTEDVARAVRMGDFEELDYNVDFDEEEIGMSTEDAISEIEKAYFALTNKFEEKNKIYLELTSVDGEAEGTTETYFWTVPLLLSRKLQELEVKIESWTEFG